MNAQGHTRNQEKRGRAFTARELKKGGGGPRGSWGLRQQKEKAANVSKKGRKKKNDDLR